MKFSNTTPNKRDRRFHPLRLVISCTLIALLLVSTSVGLSYARYHNVASNTENVNFLGNDFIHSENVVFAYINRDDDTVPTVLDYHNGEVTVTIPRGLSAEANYIAYALMVKDYSPAAYDITEGNYKVSTTLRLYGIPYPTGDTLTLKPVATSSGKRINTKIKAEAGIASATSNRPNSWGLTVDPLKDYVEFTAVSNLGTNASTSDVTFNVTYHKTSWSDNADTSWYDPDDPQTSYELDRAGQLAGLAKLVNGDPENNIPGIDFAGVTFTLSDDISLYGTGGEGDYREWTPIGTEDNPFKGNFNGAGHSITGLALSGGIEADNIGLFGVVEGDANSFIKNLTLTDPLVYAASDKSVGTVVGKATGYKVSNVDIAILDISGKDDAVVGLLAGSVDNVFNCEEGCSIDSNSNYDFVGKVISGGPTDPPVVVPTEAPTEAPTQKPTANYELPVFDD